MVNVLEGFENVWMEDKSVKEVSLSLNTEKPTAFNTEGSEERRHGEWVSVADTTVRQALSTLSPCLPFSIFSVLSAAGLRELVVWGAEVCERIETGQWSHNAASSSSHESSMSSLDLAATSNGIGHVTR